jgi:carbon-monoxide dehydrogenase large subunit
MRLASLIMWKATNEIIARGKRVAALLLQAKPEAIEFTGGRFVVAGSAQAIDLFEVSAAMLRRTDLPEDLRGPLAATVDEVVPEASFPFGSHVCEVEIDPETGAVTLLSYTVVDDVGTVVNPMGLEGQIHGGLVQGVGQALMEQVLYDPRSGQLLTGSFMDYAMPRADNICDIAVASNPVPTKLNPLGVKGAGEAGTVGALPAVMNAVLDALAPLGIDALDMPATPERIWRAIEEAKVR